jgi:hypothetical protein
VPVAVTTLVDDAFDVDPFIDADLPFNAYYPGGKPTAPVVSEPIFGGFPWWQPFYIFNYEKQPDWDKASDLFKKLSADERKRRRKQRRKGAVVPVRTSLDFASLPKIVKQDFSQGVSAYQSPDKIDSRTRREMTYIITRAILAESRGFVARRSLIERQNTMLLLDLFE